MKYQITESIKKFIEENNLTDFEGIFLALNLRNIKEYIYDDILKKDEIATGDIKEIIYRLTFIKNYLEDIVHESVKSWYNEN